MTDPLTVGIGVAAVAFIVGLIFYFIAKRDNFENWYSQQRQLEEEEKKKNKKPAKPKAKKNDAQKETQTKSEKRESVSGTKSDEETDGKSKNKKNKKRDSESKSEASPNPDAKKKAESPKTEKPAEKKAEKPKEQSIRERSPLKNKNDSEGFTEVKTKAKKSPEKQAEQAEKTTVETPKEEKITVHKVKDAQKAPEQKKAPQPKNDENMGMGKLLLDMAAGTVGQAHVQFLRTYVENVTKKEKAATSASQEKDELLKQIQNQTGKIRSLEETIAHHRTEKAGLTDHVNQLAAKEKQLTAELQKTKQIATASAAEADTIKKTQQQIVVLTKQVEASKDLARRHEQAVAEVAALKRDLAAGEDQIASLVAKLSQLETRTADTQLLVGANSEIAALKQTILGLKQELDNARTIEIESSEVTELKQKVKDMQAELAESQKMKDALDTMQDKWNELRNTIDEYEANPKPLEYEAEIAALKKESAAHKEHAAAEGQKHAKLMEEYLAMKSLVEKIQGEVRNFEEMQKNVRESQALVDKQKEEIKKFLKEQDALHAETMDLHKQIAELKKQLASGQSQNGNLGEEAMIQKAAHTTAAAPPSAPSSDYEKLVDENKRLQQKNEELRERNFKLFEMVENNSHTQSSSNNVATKVETTVVHETKDNKKKDKKSKKNDTPAPTHAPAAVESNNNEDTKLVKSYRDALIAVKSELSRISDLAEQRRERIADLEAKMNNGEWPKLHQPPTAPSTKASPSVAAAPKATVAGSKPAKKAASGSEAGEEDWELVD